MDITLEKLIELVQEYLYAKGQDSDLKLSTLAFYLAKVKTEQIKKDFSKHCFGLVESHQEKKIVLVHLCGLAA